MNLKSLTLSNYLCFGENVKIDFPKEGNFLIMGNNADSNGMNSNESGKTSFASAPFWALFGVHYSEDASADDVIREGTKQCSVTLEIEENDDTIKIIRKRGIHNSLEFYVNGNLVNENITVPTKVQEDINRYFGITGTPKQIIDDFMTTNLLSYNSVEMFVSKRYKAEDRFAFLSRIFNLERWIECRKLAKEERIKLSPEIDNLEGRLHVYQEIVDSINYKELKNKIKDLEEDNKNKQQEANKFKKQISDAKNYTQLKKEIQRTEDVLEALEDKYQRNKKRLEDEINAIKLKQRQQIELIEKKKSNIADVKDIDNTDEKLNK